MRKQNPRLRGTGDYSIAHLNGPYASASPHPIQREELLLRVTRYCRSVMMCERELGRAVKKDSKLIGKLRDGRLKQRSLDQIERYLGSHGG